MPEHCDSMCFSVFPFNRDLQIESLKRDMELLRAELERVKAEVRTVVDGEPFAWVSVCFLFVYRRGVTVEGIIIYVQRNLGQMLGGCKCCS